jgi:hypothetical protein
MPSFISLLSILGDEALLGLGPVDDLPDVLEVPGPVVDVLEVVSVLPDVDGDNGVEGRTRSEHGVLVRGRHHVQALGLLALRKENPAGSFSSFYYIFDVKLTFASL